MATSPESSPGSSPEPAAVEAERVSQRKPLRADARRNRARLLEAAEVVFAAKGSTASTEEIASRAGVGIGTLFRHFPTKEALIEAILVTRVARLAEEADNLATKGDAATAFFAYFTLTVVEAETKKMYTDLLADNVIDIRAVAPELYQRLRHGVGTLLAHAQEAGTVRTDIGVSEVMALLVGAIQAIENARADRELRDRILAVFLDGLRPPYHR
jgi:AcrR family transcriptional regulator